MTEIEKQISLKNPLTLAFIGDAVISLHVRNSLVTQFEKIETLHQKTAQLVCAKTQSLVLDKIKDNFTEIESDIARRAHNAKHKTTPKNQTLGDYRNATALEAVVGFNYLIQNQARLNEILEIVMGESQ
ncbi:MAG: ribonuclease III [Firmicutes bacterium]|nr:ribonuclease III [Bacillota bacterium]